MKSSSAAKTSSSEPAQAASPGGRWAVDASLSGDAGCIKVTRDDVLLVVITGADADIAETRERARELLDDAHEGVPATSGRGIPPVMQRVIRSLLEWSEEAHETPDAAWWAIAFMHSATAPMLAHVGGEEPRVLSASGAITPQSNLLRGKNGVHVRAMSLRPGCLPTLSVTWATEPRGARDAYGVALQADWQLEPREIEPEDAAEEMPEEATPPAPMMRLVEIVPEAAAPTPEAATIVVESEPEPSPPIADLPSPTEAIITDEERRMLETIFDRREPALFEVTPLEAPPREAQPEAVPEATEPGPEHAAIESPFAFPDSAPEAPATPLAVSEPIADTASPAEDADDPLWDDAEPASTPTPIIGDTRSDDASLIEAILADVDVLPGGGFVVTSLDTQMEEAARGATPASENTEESLPIEAIVLDESAMESLDDDDDAPSDDSGADDEAAFSALFESAYESSTGTPPTKPEPTAAEPQTTEPVEGEPQLTWLSSTPEGDAAAAKPAPESTIKIFEPWAKGANGSGRPMRPARPLIIGPSKRSVTAAEPAETARSGRPKRPRPQIVKLQRGASEAPPTTRPLAPTRPRQRWFDDPKNQRNALILGGLVIVGVVISALMMPGGDKSHGKPAAGSTQHPVDLGPTGANRVVIEATVMEADVPKEARGAQVWIDGRLRGSAPLNVELAPGPHSIRVSHKGEDSPVRLVTIPGDQMQTLAFQFGTTTDLPHLSLLNHEPPAMLDRVAVITAYMDRISDDDLEMWLNLRENGEWHNFPMSLQPAPGGTVGVAVVPADRLKAPKAAPYYVSAKRKATGEQYVTEMQNSGSL